LWPDEAEWLSVTWLCRARVLATTTDAGRTVGATGRLPARGGGQCQGQGEGAVEEHESAVVELAERVFDCRGREAQVEFPADGRCGGRPVAAGEGDDGQGVVEGVDPFAGRVPSGVDLEGPAGRAGRA